jgi:hypothetical protein
LQFLAGSRSHPSKPKLRAPASQNQNGATKGKAKADHTSALRNGAQEAGVDEPARSKLTIPLACLPILFDEVAEPKDLSPEHLAKLASIHGAYKAVALAIGASEAFVRQSALRKRYKRRKGLTQRRTEVK